MIDIGSLAPDFTLSSDTGDVLTLSSLRGKKVILYFYPKDNTSGCTQQACAFRDALPEFSALNGVVLGVSKDSLKSHASFRSKQNLNFPLLSDESVEVCEKYGVWVEKSMYGRKYMGIDRSTFLIDEKGIIQKIWRKVKITNHIPDVLKSL
ncbi:MAG: thioredoxin-dependent thiol peroxidase [Candidatus Paracaedibacteraceae bacterium]|nr:thioredoxin-dependent thiol peroxidase [Candidatus Paracaedibacteraceae bacterium]